MARRVKIHAPERLKTSHQLDAFDCGVQSMNHWLKRVARRADDRTAAVFVIRAGSRVIGYYATAMGSVPRVDAGRLGQDTPDPVPVFVLARLAVDNGFKGRGLGQDLVADALKRGLRASRSAGMRAVVVHTLTDDLVKFYEALGFQALETNSRTMFIAIETLQNSL